MTYLWSAKTRIGSLHFQAGCRRRWLNLALVSLCLFCVVVHFFWVVNACFCCVRFSFSIPSHEIGLGNISKVTCFVLSGTWSLNLISYWPFLLTSLILGMCASVSLDNKNGLWLTCLPEWFTWTWSRSGWEISVIGQRSWSQSAKCSTFGCECMMIWGKTNRRWLKSRPEYETANKCLEFFVQKLSVGPEVKDF